MTETKAVMRCSQYRKQKKQQLRFQEVAVFSA